MHSRLGDLISPQYAPVGIAAKPRAVGHGHHSVLRHHQIVERARIQIDEQPLERRIRRHGRIHVQ